MTSTKEANFEKRFTRIPHRQITVKNKRAIYRQGNIATHVFYIRRGRVKLSTNSKQGKEAVVAILGPGDLFGEGSVVGRTVHLANATAIEECVLKKAKRDDVLKGIHADRKFADFFLQYVLRRSRAIEENLVDLMFNSTEKRLARALLLLANFGTDQPPQPVSHPVNQETLAAVVGSTRSRVNFFMNKFKRLGFIRYDEGLEVNGALMNVLLTD